MAGACRSCRESTCAVPTRGSASPSPTTTSAARASTTTCSPTPWHELQAKGIAVESEGALCAFPPGFTGRDGEPLPVIIRKSDGGYNYSTTDLATIRYRVDELHADRAIYVVGAAQALHFQMVFAVARQAGWIPGRRALRARPDRRRARPGREDPAHPGRKVDQADGNSSTRLWSVRGRSSPTGTRTPRCGTQIAEAVGIGALKYADLSVARDSGYVFDFDRMLALQRQHRARTCSTRRRGSGRSSAGPAGPGPGQRRR